VTCVELTPLLSDLLDDDLPAATRAATEAHLAACTECSRAYRALRRTVRFVRSNAATPLVPGTPGGVYASFNRATADESYGRSPIEVMLEGLASLSNEGDGP
jgi:anti-sigma factor RsiW